MMQDSIIEMESGRVEENPIVSAQDYTVPSGSQDESKARFTQSSGESHMIPKIGDKFKSITTKDGSVWTHCEIIEDRNKTGRIQFHGSGRMAGLCFSIEEFLEGHVILEPYDLEDPV